MQVNKSGPDFPTPLNKNHSAKNGEPDDTLNPLRVADFDPSEWINSLLPDIEIKSEPDSETPLLYMGDVVVLTLGNHLLVYGKKKSRKTLFIVYLISQYRGSINDILWFDTEQGKHHVWGIRNKILKITKQELQIFYLRGRAKEDRKKIIEFLIQIRKPKLIVIDGVRDLLVDINNPADCDALMEWLEALARKYSIGIVSVLHANKNDGNARGHIGSELTNKSQTNIELENDKSGTGCTIVKCADSRDIPFEDFAIMHDLEGLPQVVNNPVAGEILSNDDKKKRLRFVFNENLLKRKDLEDGIKMHFGVSRNPALKLIGDFLRSGWVVKSGGDHSPNVVYKLMV